MTMATLASSFLSLLIVLLSACLLIPEASAASMSPAEMQQRIEFLEKQVQSLKGLEKQIQALKRQLATSPRKSAQVRKKPVEAAGAVAAARHAAAVAQQQAAAAQAAAAAAQQSAAAARQKASEEETSLIKVGLHGVVATDFVGTDAKGKHSSFVAGKFLPIFLASYSDWLLLESHLEFVTTSLGETEASLEYAQLDLMATDWLTFVAGKFLSPIGQFQQALHPPWINKLPDRPAGFVEDGGDEPLTEVGVMVRGGFPIGPMKATYAVFGGNGPRLSDSGPALEGFGGDNNGDKSFGGRVSLFPIPHLEVGVSGMRSTIGGIPAMTGPVSSAEYHLIDVDAAYTNGPWDVRGELISAHLGSLVSAFDPSDPAPTAIPATDWFNWYLQAAYRLSGLTEDPILSRFEPVIRYGQLHVSGFDGFRENDEDRFSVGLDYWFAPSVVAKAAYENRDFLHKPTAHVFRLQFAYGF
jgi:hypothetical protein